MAAFVTRRALPRASCLAAAFAVVAAASAFRLGAAAASGGPGDWRVVSAGALRPSAVCTPAEGRVALTLPRFLVALFLLSKQLPENKKSL
jgi:hypothetical protein